jgi:hypothetical protein
MNPFAAIREAAEARKQRIQAQEREVELADEAMLTLLRESGVKPVAEWLKTYALSCETCHALSVPIPDTGDRYRCISCERQFIGPEHEINPRLRWVYRVEMKRICHEILIAKYSTSIVEAVIDGKSINYDKRIEKEIPALYERAIETLRAAKN